MNIEERHESVSPHTSDILRKAVAAAEQDAKKLDMRQWLTSADGTECDSVTSFIQFGGECGATLCLAGFILAVAPEESRQKPAQCRSIENLATVVSGLSPEAADVLFYSDNWPEAFESQYRAAPSPAERVEALRQRVEYFILTGE